MKGQTLHAEVTIGDTRIELMEDTSPYIADYMSEQRQIDARIERFRVNITNKDGSFEAGMGQCYEAAIGRMSIALGEATSKLYTDMRNAHTFEESGVPAYPEEHEKYYLEVEHG